MADIRISGGRKLSGEITPAGNKNSVLPILCATLLTDETVTLKNVPNLTDVNKILEILKELGSDVNYDEKSNTAVINNSKGDIANFKKGLPLGMRAALLLVSPMLARFKTLSINPKIGGCTLGIREIDPHISMLTQMGAKIERNDEGTTMTLDRYKATLLWPDYASVTATENVIMAAAVANGTTVINNAAAEPHVQDLCNVLIKMGAKIEGVGSSRLVIEGVDELSGCEFEVTSDHHEITTYLALGAMTGGEIKVHKAIPEHFPLIVSTFKKLGVEIEYEGDTAIVRENQSFEPEKPFTENFVPRIEAAPWPYFPVDLLPLMIALSLKTKGPIRFWNKVYEGGLFWVSELMKMNAIVEVEDPHRIIVLGPTNLQAASLESPSIIRATVALMMAAMAAPGTSTLKNIDTIYRAHPGFIENLKMLGASITEA